jgi:hypothetical protein
MAAEWAERGAHFSIELDTFGFNSRATRLTRLRTEMMAGLAPDIILLENNPWEVEHSIRSFFTAGMFTNFYELIDNDPNVNREDFYTNVLEAWEYDGRLYVFPLTFGFEYAGINASLPRSVIDKFTAFDTITMHELLKIYLYLKKTYYDDFGHLSIFDNHRFSSAFYVLSHSMNGFVDYVNNISHLNNPKFIALLEDWQQVFNGRGLFTFNEQNSPFLSPFQPITGHLPRIAEQYVFSVEERLLGPATALLPNSNPHFINYIPITDEQGRLRMSHTAFQWAGTQVRPMYVFGSGHIVMPAISAAADGALAWEYIQHLISLFVYSQRLVEYQHFATNTLVTPIKRDYFETHILNTIESAFIERGAWIPGTPSFVYASDEEKAQAIETAISRLATYNEMPVSPPFMLPSGLFGSVLDTFFRTPMGTVFGARETAYELHNRVGLWLIE